MSRDDAGVTDWQEWHRDYDDRDSSLSRRLAVVQRWMRELVTAERPVRSVLSLCAGDGRDVLPVVAELPPDRRPDVTLVELDADLAAAAERRATDLGVEVTVLVGDAGAATSWRHVLPVDLLLLCGVFGNIADGDIRTTIAAARSMLTDDGHVVWTRGARGEVDLRPRVRRWFEEAGFVEIHFEGEPQGYGVGVSRLPDAARREDFQERLFTFIR